MRRNDVTFKLLILFWAFILFEEIFDFISYYFRYGLASFNNYNFYLDVAIIGVLIGIFVFSLKGNMKIIIILFGVLVTLFAIQNLPILLSDGIYLINHINGYEKTTLFALLSTSVLRPISLMFYSLFYIVSLALYLLKHKLLIKVADVTSLIGILVLISNVCVSIGMFLVGVEELNFFQIFFSLLSSVFFSMCYYYIPKYMDF